MTLNHLVQSFPNIFEARMALSDVVSKLEKMSPSIDVGPKPKRQSQAERREITQVKVLESARKIFGEKGYADTSLKDIADDLGLTITPIYHYFGNKKSLFLAVTESMELEFTQQIERVAENVTSENLFEIWDMLIEMTQQRDFVRIVLSDAPNYLGRDRWDDTSVVQAVTNIFREHLSIWIENGNLAGQFSENDILLVQRMLIGCFTEAALMLAANPSYDSRPLILKILTLFSGMDATR